MKRRQLSIELWTTKGANVSKGAKVEDTNKKRKQLSIERWITKGAKDTNKKRKRGNAPRKADTDLVFLLFTVASCGLCQGCDLCRPEVCDGEPEKANAIRKDGIIYKQVGHEFNRTFASLTCLFIRMREDFKYYTTASVRVDHKGRSYVQISDDNGYPFKTQALKFASLAWGRVSPATKLGTVGMRLRDFGHAFSVDHIDGNPSNNHVSNGMIMTKAEHDVKTIPTLEKIARASKTRSSPCTMTLFDLENKPLLDSGGRPVVINYEHRKEAMSKFGLTRKVIGASIRYNRSLVPIKYEGKDCLAQFTWYNLPDLVGEDGRKEKWVPISAADYQTWNLSSSLIFDYFVSDMGRWKQVTKSTKNAKIINYQGRDRPRCQLMRKDFLFYRIVALVFHREQMNAKILEKKEEFFKETGKELTYDTLHVDHIKEGDPTNHFADNLQFLTPKENQCKTAGRPCRFWEKNFNTVIYEYRTVKAAAKAMGMHASTARKILKNKLKYKNWQGEYIVT